MATSIDPAYAELRCRTNFSFLEGASHPEELVAQAKAAGLSALAVTDRCGLYGVVRAHLAAKAAGLAFVAGSEVAVGPQPVVLLCASRKGYGNLCRLISLARQRPDRRDTELSWEEIADHSRGLLALAPPPYDPESIASAGPVFEKRLFLALHRTLEASDGELSRQALDISKRFSVPVVATNDVHYHAASRQALHDVLTAIRRRTTVEKAGRLLFPNAERRIKSAAEMASLFSDLPAALSRTVDIARACRFSLDELRYVYPDEFLPAGKTADGWLAELTWESAKKRYPAGIPDDVRKQLGRELRLIRELRFADYFLTIHDIVTYARSRGILCQGRGSAANSAVCYVLGVTAIDPVRMNLLFERFISAERGEPPDIDVDFEHERREEVIQYVYERYGRDRAGIAAEVVTYRHRSALRDVAKALGVPHADAVRLSKSFHRRDHKEINEQHLHEQGLDPRESKTKLLAALAREIEGFPRHLSTHVGGFVLTRDPLIENVPIEKAAMPGRTIIQWDKSDLDALGMLKVDILGLGMLTCIRKCLELVPPLTLSAIPAEDPKVYDTICAADTVGVFQIESRAQMGMLPRLLPRTFHDLVIEVAIVRPGPIVGKMVHPYLRRRRGEEAVRYPHPALKEILGKTFGVPLFQEQVMKIAMAVANFSAGEADRLRRAMGIWRTHRSAGMESMARRLIEGMRRNGVGREDALTIFEQIRSFGEFGFPESHSASFALLVYASAWLKCYHPAAFACALLNSQPMGFYSPHSVVDDARRHKVEVRPADIVHSNWDCTLERGALRLGLRLIRGLGKKAGRAIEEERGRRPFDSLEDFVSRTDLGPLRLLFLASADAFHSLGLERRAALWKLQAMKWTPGNLYAGRRIKEEAVSLPELSPADRVTADYAMTGLSVFAHPMEILRPEFDRLGARRIRELGGLPPGRAATTGGLAIVRQSPPTARGMVFITLEDETGLLNTAVRPNVYGTLRPALSKPFLLVRGTVQRDGKALSLLVSDARPVAYPRAGRPPAGAGEFQ